ncbi:MAG: hypothetical protein EWV53_01715 [Microcystis panniformis Mp_MB_F_20051200_S9]|uniref:DUF2281 domain-containing protein n=1 Tax=Microcystis panniformis Mp_MB_F_20051200_S9 TaxID=2486223 RepID=A0A552Q9X3_9CHRO|nr:MAG: hypothetical protein EWV43_15265 [Microcystis panniformis Mp_MB_F_20080800_S26D]TRV46505.1 MAG: hypothetical protein EWV42_17655 [Microcystis panniformis Mp_GB_SS_20050300_S99D]TRV53531.1 MAG: hypothetical protein EWV87_02295 [Microcystis panniformis Mp_GB_SS_20050300_S99]TRV62635.1 MAG: hypothetical protein EWV69_04940 [Microcystis panniformis Mp_MB_F_20080800_S26]TRV66011.1 MAG: hypothetical protein EWV53_01715 [Microcystis panniformis Mp_MB_F_20051200_S9]TRV66402.1 MAG: hypothetical
MTFSEVVEAIKTLSLGEKEEIQFLLEQFLREEQRDKIYQNYLVAKQNEKEGKLKFSSDTDELMQFLEEYRN